MAFEGFTGLLKLLPAGLGSNRWMTERADARIADMARSGRREEAFEMLVATYQHRVYRLALTMLRNPQAAEDATQETFLRVWKALPGFRGESELSTWIYSIARNRCLSMLGRGSFKREVTVEQVPEVAADPQELEPFPMLMEALGQLDGRQREAVALFYLEEKSYEEMSRLMGIPIGSVKTYLHRARKLLTEFFAERQEPAADRPTTRPRDSRRDG
jgi:RNA polymerase sigma-70 factor (ECF subfamily)